MKSDLILLAFPDFGHFTQIKKKISDHFDRVQKKKFFAPFRPTDRSSILWGKFFPPLGFRSSFKDTSGQWLLWPFGWGENHDSKFHLLDKKFRNA